MVEHDTIARSACGRFRSRPSRTRPTSVYQAAIRTPLVRLDLPVLRRRHRPGDLPQARSTAADWVVQDSRRVERRAGAAAAMRSPHGVWTVSAGNAAQGVAFAARSAGAPCSVMVMDTAPQTKLRSIERLGATHRHGHLRRMLANRRAARVGSRCTATSCIRSTTTGSSPATARRAWRFSKICPTSTRSSRRSAAAGCSRASARRCARSSPASRSSPPNRKRPRRWRRRSRAARPATSTVDGVVRRRRRRQVGAADDVAAAPAPGR